MSSIKSSFNYDENEYDPTIDNQFIDNLYQLILKGNVKKVKEFISIIIANKEILNDIDIYRDDYCPLRIGSPCIDDYNADINYYDGGDYEESQDSLKDNKLLDLTFSNEFSPLMLASQKGIPELVEYFISLKFDVNKTIVRTGLTPLLAACSSSPDNVDIQTHCENITICLKLLLNAGADPTVSLIKNKQSPLHLLVANNNVSACRYIVDIMDIDGKTTKECTALMIAACRGYYDIVNILIEAGSNLSLRNANGLSAVELAMINNHQDVVKLLVRPTDNLEFYGAWCAVYKDLIEVEKHPNIKESFVKKFYSSKYFSDPIACMCATLNLTHLQPILEKNGITFATLRSMSDGDMKNIGISKFSDRKCLLNMMQDVHKVSWAHQTSIYTPNYKLSITPFDMLDVVRNASEHLDFIQSSIKYIGHHLNTNPSYYLNYSQNKNFFDKCVGHCDFAAYKAHNIHDSMVKIDSIFDKMYQYALEEDISGQLDDDVEKWKQDKLTKRFSNSMKTGIIVSGLSILAIVLLRSRLVNI